MLGVVFLSGVSGGLVSHFGYYWPFLVGGPVFICIGSGLLYTIDEFTPNSKLIGYQIVSCFISFNQSKLTRHFSHFIDSCMWCWASYAKSDHVSQGLFSVWELESKVLMNFSNLK